MAGHATILTARTCVPVCWGGREITVRKMSTTVRLIRVILEQPVMIWSVITTANVHQEKQVKILQKKFKGFVQTRLFSNQFVTNQAIQSQKIAGGLK